MARPQFQPHKKVLRAPPQTAKEPLLLIETKLNGGMNSQLDAADLPPSQFTLAKNSRTEADRVYRRPGLTKLATTKPNSQRVLLYTLCTEFDRTNHYIRFDKTAIYKRGSGSWSAVTGSALGLTDSSRPRLIAANNRFFFTTGVDKIQEIDVSAGTYADLGNAPKYKYIFSLFNRIIGANLYHASAPNPIQVGWSGDLNFDEWNPAVDISAGSDPLIEAGSDYTDEITGGFGFAQVGLILRERSLWLLIKRPVASKPFQYQQVFTLSGCDVPNSATQKRNGIVWYDRRSNQVYDYTIGESPIPIGDAIKAEIVSRITNVDLVDSSYDTAKDRYYLLVYSEASNVTTTFVFDRKTASWSYDEMSGMCSLNALDTTSLPLMIDDLVGMISDLSGMIDDLAYDSIVVPAIAYGDATGDIYFEDESVDTDDGDVVSMDLRSKVFRLQKGVSVSRLLFALNVHRPSTVTISFSRDSGRTWTAYKTLTLATNGRCNIHASRQVTGNEYLWKLESSTGLFDILESRIEGLQTIEIR